MVLKDWLTASDPGLTRLRTAFNGAFAMATGLGVEYAISRMLGVTGQSVLVAMLLGAVVAMMGSMGLTGSNILSKIKTASLFPVAMGLGVVAGVAVGHNTDLMLVVFVAVMFVAVAIRRFGMPYFYYGFMGWMGYFFASFLGPSWSEIPFMMAAVIAGTLWILLLSSTVLRTRPQRALEHTMSAFAVRARGVAATMRDVMLAPPGPVREELRLTLRMRTAHLSEAALMVEGWLAETQVLPKGWSALGVRRRLLDVQNLMDRMASDAAMLDGDVGALAASVASAIAREEDQRAAQILVHLQEVEGPQREAAIDFSNAAARFLALTAEARLVRQTDNSLAAEEEFEPAVQLMMENLPGSPAAVQGVSARGSKWNFLAKQDLSLRQAVQVAVAGGLAIIFGRLLSPERYYWAVIAAFIMSAGTATRVEAMLKGINRVVGTVAGLVAAVAVAQLTTGHVIVVLAAIVVAMFCGFYLQRVSYAYFIFFLTIMLGELYSVLHEFSAGLLWLRLEETAIGVAVGLVVAMVIVPLSRNDTIHSVRQAFLDDLQCFFDEALDGVDHPEKAASLDQVVRRLENHYRQLVQVADPVTPPLAWGFSRPQIRHRLGLYAALSGYVRTLTVALREAPVDERTEELKSILSALANGVRHIREAGLGSPLVFAVEADALVQWDRFNPIARPLVRIQHLLVDFATSEPL